MTSEKVERRLAAILAADVVGFSRLIGFDEEGTIARLRKLRKELIDPCISKHNGRIVKTTGDGILIEFPSVVEAMRCAVEVQRALAELNTQIPNDKRIEFRVGVNLGDIVVQDDDILGDGVNVAARLEGLADPGGICIPRKVFQEVKDKLDVGYEYTGEQKVKNIEAPIPAYRVIIDPDVSGEIISEKATIPSRARLAAISFSLTVLLAVIGALVWWQPWQSAVEITNEAASEQPSIAVLPFQNMSDDESQVYFADGIAEDIITDLSKISGLFVIARNTSFQYRDRSVDISSVGRTLAVSYVLEGSVRRVDDRVRINAQLIDVNTGGHVWAERYDGLLADVFSLQDQVTGRVIDALKVQLTSSEQVALDLKGTENPVAYDAYLRGLSLLSARRRLDVDANRAAQAEFEKAIRIDPDYAPAHAGLAWTRWLYIESISDLESTAEVFSAAERSIELGDNALAHRVLSKKHLSLMYPELSITRRPELAIAELERARELQPNDPDILIELAVAMSYSGKADAAWNLIQLARSHNPDHPRWYYGASGIVQLLSGDAGSAVRDLRLWSGSDPTFDMPYLFLASALAHTGDEAAAREAIEKFSWYYLGGLTGEVLLPFVRSLLSMADEPERIITEGLRLAGMRETHD